FYSISESSTLSRSKIDGSAVSRQPGLFETASARCPSLISNVNATMQHLEVRDKLVLSRYAPKVTNKSAERNSIRTIISHLPAAHFSLLSAIMLEFRENFFSRNIEFYRNPS